MFANPNEVLFFPFGIQERMPLIHVRFSGVVFLPKELNIER
jgi:hypothetical protein